MPRNKPAVLDPTPELSKEDIVTTATEEVTETEAPEAEETSEVEETTEVEVPEAPIDLTAFKAAVEAARGFANPETSELSAEQLTEVRAAFQALSGTKGKNAARKWLRDETSALMLPGPTQDFQKATATYVISDSLKAEKAPKSERAPKAPKAPVDPTEDFINKYLAVVVAQNIVKNNPPEGVAEDWKSRAQTLINQPEVQEGIRAYGAWAVSTDEAKGDAPEVPAFVTNGYKIAAGKASSKSAKKSAGSTRSSSHEGPGRNVVKHIEEAFADKPVGTFLKVSQIVAHTSSEYGDDHPSSGAVSSRIGNEKSWPKVQERTGLVPEMVEGTKGLRKTA